METLFELLAMILARLDLEALEKGEDAIFPGSDLRAGIRSVVNATSRLESRAAELLTALQNDPQFLCAALRPNIQEALQHIAKPRILTNAAIGSEWLRQKRIAKWGVGAAQPPLPQGVIEALVEELLKRTAEAGFQMPDALETDTLDSKAGFLLEVLLDAELVVRQG